MEVPLGCKDRFHSHQVPEGFGIKHNPKCVTWDILLRDRQEENTFLILTIGGHESFKVPFVTRTPRSPCS